MLIIIPQKKHKYLTLSYVTIKNSPILIMFAINYCRSLKSLMALSETESLDECCEYALSLPSTVTGS